MEVAIHSYLVEHNDYLKPFAWTAKKEADIFEKASRGESSV